MTINKFKWKLLQIYSTVLNFAFKIQLALQLISQIQVVSNLSNQFAIIVSSSAFSCFSVSVVSNTASQQVFIVFLFINQYLHLYETRGFLFYFSILQFNFVFFFIFSMHLYFKTYQFIHCFNSSLLALVVMVTCTFTFARKIFNLFISFTYGFTFILV